MNVNRHFGGTYRLHLHGRKISRTRNQRERRWQAELFSCSAYSSTLKMEVKCSSETSVDFQRTTRRCQYLGLCSADWWYSEVWSIRRVLSWLHLRHYFGICLKGLTKTREVPARIVFGRAKIRTGHFPNTSQKRYSLVEIYRRFEGT
jgi:hypothetical protein